MYTPLNGSVLNGSSYGVWADNAVASSSAECSASIRRVVPGKGVAAAESSSGSVGVREAGMFATVTAVAEQTAVGVRIAGFKASDSAQAIGTASAPILRWSDAIAEVSAALPPPIPWRHAYTDSSVTSTSEFTVNNEAIVVYAVVGVKRSPARASIYVHETSVRELRTTIINRSGFSLAIARTYAIANSPLGFGEINLAAESTGSGLFITHDFKGTCEATAEGIVDPARVRAYDAAQPAIAESNSEPNVTTGGVTYAYMAGTAASEAVEVCNALRVRIHKTQPALNTAQTTLVPYYELDHRGKAIVVAKATGELGPTYKALWYRKGQGSIQGNVESNAEGIKYTWVYIEGDSGAKADATSDAIRYRWIGADGVAISRANQINTAYLVRGFEAVGTVVASVVSVPTRYAYTYGFDQGFAEISNTGTVYGWTYFKGKIQGDAATALPGLIHYKAQHVTGELIADANSVGVGLRLYTLETVKDSNAAQSTGAYWINIGKAASPSRTYQIEPDDRVYTVESMKREYTL